MHIIKHLCALDVTAHGQTEIAEALLRILRSTDISNVPAHPYSDLTLSPLASAENASLEC